LIPREILPLNTATVGCKSGITRTGCPTMTKYVFRGRVSDSARMSERFGELPL
jgi:hypothetical protein